MKQWGLDVEVIAPNPTSSINLSAPQMPDEFIAMTPFRVQRDDSHRGSHVGLLNSIRRVSQQMNNSKWSSGRSRWTIDC